MEVDEPKLVSGEDVEILHGDNGFALDEKKKSESEVVEEEEASVIKTLKEEIQTLSMDRLELQRWKDEMKAEMERSEAEKQALAGRADYLEGEISRLHHDLGTAVSSSADSEADAQSLKKALENLQAEMASVADSKVALDARIEGLEAKIAALNAQREEAAVALSEKEAEIVALKNEMEALQLKGRALEDGLLDYKDKARQELEQEIKRKEELEKAVKELEEENSRLQDRIHGFQSESEKRDLVTNDGKGNGMAVDVHEGLKVSWAVVAAAAASTGTVAAAVTAIYLRHAKQR